MWITFPHCSQLYQQNVDNFLNTLKNSKQNTNNQNIKLIYLFTVVFQKIKINVNNCLWITFFNRPYYTYS